MSATPDTGLVDGQAVQVVGSGFAPSTQVTVGECRSGATSGADCALAGAVVVTTDASGGFTTPFSVSRSLAISTPGLDCSIAGTCVLAAGQLSSFTGVSTTPLLFAPASQPAASSTDPSTRYYLALGDSLATGFGAPTGQGYVDDLAAHFGTTIPGLQEVDLGCAGETTVTFVNGGKCTYAQGSQLAAAEAFLSGHPGQIAFVTIDIGGDDITPCASGTTISTTCVANAIAQISTNLQTIGAGLRSAGGSSVQIAGMNYFDPFVVEWLNGPAGQALATLSVTSLDQLNAALSAAYVGFGASVADVASAFSSDDLTDIVASPYGTVPKSVAVACAWLFVQCKAGGGVTPSVHPNATGYAAIAGAFEAVLGGTTSTPPSAPQPTLAMTGSDPLTMVAVGGCSAMVGASIWLALGRRRVRRVRQN